MPEPVPPRVDRETLEFLATIESEEDLPREPDQLIAEGWAWLHASRYAFAEFYFRRAAQLARKARTEGAFGEATLLLGRVLSEQGRAREALSVLSSLLDVRLSTEATFRWNALLGYVLFEFCRYDLADRCYRRAIDAADLYSERLAAGARTQRAAVLRNQGHVEAALRESQACGPILERTDQTGGVTTIALINEGLTHLQGRGDVDGAMERFERSRLPAASENLKVAAYRDILFAEAALLSGDLELARTFDHEAAVAASQAGIAAIEPQVLVHRVVMDEDDPVVQVAELDETARRYYMLGMREESARLWSTAAILAGRRSLPAEPYHQHVRAILGPEAAAQFDAHHRRLFAGVERPRPRLRVRWAAGRPMLETPAGETAAEVRVGDLDAAIFVSDPELAPLVRKPLGGFRTILTFHDWRKFERVAASMNLAFVVLPSLAEEEHRRPLAGLKARAPFLPLVLVTRRDFEAIARIADLEVDEVVWIGEIERTLRSAALRAASRTLLSWIATTLSRAEHLPTPLREALVYACRTRLPVRSVAELADAAERHRTTLGRMWRSAVHGRLRLEDFLAWLLLLRAVGRRPSGMSWAGVAAEFEVHEQTLRKTARRLAGKSPDELADASGQAWLVERFVHQVLDPLFDDGRIDSR